MKDWLPNFVSESNRIEGIRRAPTKAELRAHLTFLELETVTIDDLVRFVAVIQPDAQLRDKKGLNVRVGAHVAPEGSENIRVILEALLEYVNGDGHPYHEHCRFETLHPFTDGNGRSGRVLWLWMMLQSYAGAHQAKQLGFLHCWYYQSLEHARP